MNGAPRGRLCLIVLLVAAVVAGCGGSSNNERTQLVNKLHSQLGTSNLPAPLGTCIVQHAQGLPLDQLRAVANSGSTPPASVKQLGLKLISDCMQPGGPGLTAMHQLIVQTFDQQGGSSLPPAFKTCFEQNANATTTSQLMQLLTVYASQGSSAAQAQSVQLGRQLGAECLTEPNVIDGLRASFLAPLKAQFRKSRYSPAFKACVIGKLEKVTAKQLETFAFNPAQANSLGYKFGRDAARACIASGAKP